MNVISVGGHAVIAALVSSESVVVDLGANHGVFANEVAERFQCKVYAVEASPKVFMQIKSSDLVRTFNYAICGTSGPVSLNISSNSEATSVKKLNRYEYVDIIQVQGLTMEDFLNRESIRHVDLLKIDIEGAEIEMLMTCSDSFLGSLQQITVEFHEWMGAGSYVDVQKVVQRLRSLGFRVFKLSRHNYGEVLFVHRSLVTLSDYVSTNLRVWVPRVIQFLARKLVRFRKG
jgi:FkbM family methyltransferase